MPGLLTPAFLFGLAALAVPLLVHLIRRERDDAVEFPSLMFISRIPQPTVKRRRIRNWWLFALRSLALLLLVGAFARPFVERPPASVAAADIAREMVILLDRSWSMGYGDRWERAAGAAREAVDGMGPNDRATLVFFDAGADVAVTATTDRARLRQAIDAAAPSAGGTRYTPGLKLAESLLEASELPRREAVLISDFQRSGWEGAAGVRFPAGAVLRPVMIGGEQVTNLTVTGVALARARVSGRERVTATAQLAMRGEPATAEVPVTLEVGGRVVQTVRVRVAANSTASAEFQPLTLGDAPVAATVRIPADALAADNEFHFVLAPDPGVRLLIVEAPGRDGSLYLRRALELAQDPPIEVRVSRVIPGAGDLARTDVVLLNDVLPADGGSSSALMAWVNAGGGVILGLGERTLATSWSDVARQLAGGVPDRVSDRVSVGGGRLGYVDYSHPVFEPFRSPNAGAFGAARFHRYRALPTADAVAARGDTAAATAAVLARFDDGGAALVERRIGAGRALVWGSTLDTWWTDLAVQPVFLPLMHQIVHRAAGFAPPRPWSLAGQVIDVGRSGEQERIIVTPDGRRVDVAPENTLLVAAEQGFYEIREARAGSAPLALHAVNVDVAESDLSVLDPAEVAASVMQPETGVRNAAAVSLPREEQERRQSLWWYLLVAVFALLAVETVLANRRTRPAA
jgi:hypothetical protein